MGGLTLSQTGSPTRAYLFHEFVGIDTSKDPAALDVGKGQPLVSAENCSVDWRGVIHLDPGGILRSGTSLPVLHSRFYGSDMLCIAEKQGELAILKSDTGYVADVEFEASVPISSTTFNRKAVFAQRDRPMAMFSGAKWEVENKKENSPKPAYVTTIQRRLVIAGMAGKETEVWFSRVDRHDVFHDDEEPSEASVLKAVRLDIRNQIDASDAIKGLAPIDSTRLAIFTNDRVLVYQIDPDYTKWSLDSSAVIRTGTISHNSICEVGGDVFYCSRTGVYSIRRSALNGMTMYALPISSHVQDLYRSLVKSVPNPEMISACYDPDRGQYHIFFPTGGPHSTRLTLTLDPVTQETIETFGRWTTGNYLGATCGSFASGRLVFGTPYGAFDMLDSAESTEARPVATIVTPVLWHENINEPKQSRRLSVQATGHGEVIVEAWDETGRILGSISYPIGLSDGTFPDIPLIRQFSRPFQHRYRGVVLRVTLRSEKQLRLNGIAIEVSNA